MPHVWTVLARLGSPEVAGATDTRTVGAAVLSGVLFTLGLALGGLVLGGVLGMVLALVMLRFRLAERAVLPYIVASQTVPLIAIAPLVAGWGGKIAILGLGLAAVGERHGDLLLPGVLPDRGRYAARARLAPAGRCRAVPLPRRGLVDDAATAAAARRRCRSLIPAVRLAAAAAVVGAIVAEISTGTRGGIGRLIIEYAQTATGDPSQMYAAILGAALLGLVAAGAVGLLDLALRRYRGALG